MSGMAGGGVAFAAGPMPEEEKDDSLKEMFSTSTQSGGFRIKIKSGEEQHAGHVEKASRQGIKNVLNDDKHE